MLPEIFQDLSMRPSGAPSLTLDGKVAAKGEDFVSILAELDLEAIVAQTGSEGSSVNDLPEQGTVEAGAKEDQESSFLDEIGPGLAVEEESLETDESPLPDTPGLAARAGDRDLALEGGDDVSNYEHVLRSGNASQAGDRAEVAVEEGILIPAEVRKASQTTGEAESLVEPMSSAITRKDPGAGAAGEKSTQDARPLAEPAPTDPRNTSLLGEVLSEEARLMAPWKTAPKAVGGAEFQPAQAIPVPATGEVPTNRPSRPYEKTDAHRIATMTSGATPIEGTPRAEAAPVALRSERAEITRLDAVPHASGGAEAPRTAPSPTITSLQGTPTAMISAMPTPSEPLAPALEEVSGLFLEESLPLRDHHAGLGRETFQPLRAMGPMLQTDQPQAMNVVRQVADAMRLTRGAGVDIALSPEELGSVRLSLVGSDGQMNVVVQAERPETLDLMRRHIESLSQEFRAIGYGDVSFSFQSGGDSPQDGRGEKGVSVLRVEEASVEPGLERQVGLALGAGLDIRI